MRDRDTWVPSSENGYANYLSKLKTVRRSKIEKQKLTGASRRGLSKKRREDVLEKTGARCHICGGRVKGPWQADHVLSHSKGGDHSTDNYLPAHSTCNNYRWDYNPEEFREIMKLGIWVRTQIIKRSELGMNVAGKFVKHEANRIKRRKDIA